MRACDPRTALVFAGAGVAAAAAGVGSALAALSGLAAWSLWLRLPPKTLLWRVGPLLSAFGLLAVVAPFAPGATLAVVVRGFTASAVLAVAAGSVPWPAAVGTVQRLGGPAPLVAFLAILARHGQTVREEAGRAHRVLLVRGGFSRWRLYPGSLAVLLGSLTATSLARADRVADALTLRGFEGRLPGPGAWHLESELPGLALTALLLAALAAEVLT